MRVYSRLLIIQVKMNKYNNKLLMTIINNKIAKNKIYMIFFIKKAKENKIWDTSCNIHQLNKIC